MFDNIGNKIKTIAKVFCWTGIGASIISGLLTLALSIAASEGGAGIESSIFIGLIIIFFGSIVSWSISCFMYGFGQLIENTDSMAEYIDE